MAGRRDKLSRRKRSRAKRGASEFEQPEITSLGLEESGQPIIGTVAAQGERRVRLFKNGRSQAVLIAPQAGRCGRLHSIIVAAELRFGVEKRGLRKLATRVAEALDILEVLPFAPPADAVYAVIRADLETAGRPIAGNDLLIAAHAVSLGCTLVTGNEQDFARIEGLSAENWLH